MQDEEDFSRTDEQATHPLVQLASSSPDVEDGDWVEYDGYEWRVTEDGAYSVTLERLNPEDLSENIRVSGISVLDVTVKE